MFADAGGLGVPPARGAAAGTLLDMGRSGVIQVRAASLLHHPTSRKGKDILVQRSGVAGMQHNAAHQTVALLEGAFERLNAGSV